jgi:hypothetical protein
MGLFQKIQNSKSFNRGVNLDPGFNGTLEILSCKLQTCGAHAISYQAFIVDFVVRESNVPDTYKYMCKTPIVAGVGGHTVEKTFPGVKVGSQVVWFCKMTALDSFLGNVKQFAVAANESMLHMRLPPEDFDEEEMEKCLGPVLTEAGYAKLAALPKPYISGTVYGNPQIEGQPSADQLRVLTMLHDPANSLVPYYIPNRLPGTYLAEQLVTCRTGHTITQKGTGHDFTPHNWGPVGC